MNHENYEPGYRFEALAIDIELPENGERIQCPTCHQYHSAYSGEYEQ